jgi:hypothetical protein
VLRVLLESGRKLNADCINNAIESLSIGWQQRRWPSIVRYHHLQSLPFHVAVAKIKSSFRDTLKLLLESGAEVTDLHPRLIGELAFNRGGELLKLLFGAGMEMPLELREKFLLFAIQTIDAETADALIDAGTPIGADAFRWMMGKDRRKILRLLEEREEIHWNEEDKDQALVWASYNGHTDFVKRLKAVGATFPAGASIDIEFPPFRI